MTLFEIGWTILLIKNFLRISKPIIIPEFIDDILAIIVLFVLGLSIVLKKYSKKRLLVYGTVACLAIYTGYVTKYMIISISVLSIIAVCGENIKRIAKLTFNMQLLLLIFNTIYSLVFAILREDTSILWGYVYENRFRVSCGYGMPGHFADCILNLMLLWIFCNYEKVSVRNYWILIGVTILTYVTSDSRVVFCLMLMMLIGLYILKKGYFIGLIRKITIWIVPLCSMLMLMFIKLFGEGNKIGYLMDEILNTRVRLCGYNLDRYGISLFGQYCDNKAGDFSIKWQSMGVTYDNSYMWIIINLGIIWLILIMIVMFLCANSKDYLLCLMMIVWALGMMIDTDFIYTTCCFSTLVVGNKLGSKQNLQLKRNMIRRTRANPCSELAWQKSWRNQE